MGFGPIQFGGLASGLDTQAIISAILEAERVPIFQLEQQRATEQDRLSVIGTFEGLVKALRDKAKELVDGEGFFARSLHIGTEGVAEFSVEEGAQTGTHDLTVIRLAQADRYSFEPGRVDPDASLGTGSISFTYDGQPISVEISAGSDSLNGIADAINDQAGDAVTANVVNTGTSASPSYQLVITANDTGRDFTIDNLDVTGVNLGTEVQLTEAENAAVEIDGLQVERSTNVFENVIPGVTFTAISTGEFGFGASTTFSIDVDPEGIKENVQSFVDAYNEVIDFINTQSDYDPDAGAGGPLFGDAALSSVRNTIQSALLDVDITQVQNDSAGFSTLGLVGIDLDKDGRLSIDDAQFSDKIAENLDAVADLFINETDGIFVKLEAGFEDLLDDATSTSGTAIPGLFDRRRETINDIIDDIGDRIERLERNLERREEALVAQFANLEQLIGGLNAQGSFLSSLGQNQSQ